LGEPRSEALRVRQLLIFGIKGEQKVAAMGSTRPETMASSLEGFGWKRRWPVQRK